jgi:hypothetical protein
MWLCLSAILLSLLATAPAQAKRGERYLVEPTTDGSASNTARVQRDNRYLVEPTTDGSASNTARVQRDNRYLVEPTTDGSASNTARVQRDNRYLVEPTTDVSVGNTTLAPAEELVTNIPIPTVEKTTDLTDGDLDAGDSSIFPVGQLTIVITYVYSNYSVGQVKFKVSVCYAILYFLPLFDGWPAINIAYPII